MRPRRGSHLVLVLPDLHLPHHDPDALRAVRRIHHLLRRDIKRVVILGDFLDAAAWSSHVPSTAREAQRDSYIEDEIKPASELLDLFCHWAREVVYIEGNHEFRIERKCAQFQGPFLDVFSMISPRRLLTAGRDNLTWIPYASEDPSVLPHYEIAKDLIAIHGWSTAKYAARRHLDMAAGQSVVFGHCHRQQSCARRQPATGKILRAWCPGTLSRLQPLWLHSKPTEWVQGLDLLYVRNDLSDWAHFTVTIEGGKATMPDGRRI